MYLPKICYINKYRFIDTHTCTHVHIYIYVHVSRYVCIGQPNELSVLAGRVREFRDYNLYLQEYLGHWLLLS